MKKIIILLFFCFFCNLQAQNEKEKLPWTSNSFLTWEHFKGRQELNSRFKANSATGILFSGQIGKKDGKYHLNYEVNSYFYPQLSWVAESAKKEYLLQHERLHFDITELHARILRKKLLEVNFDDVNSDPKKVLDSLYEIVEKDRRDMQTRYDRETNHSINKDIEAKWQLYVKEQLSKKEENQ